MPVACATPATDTTTAPETRNRTVTGRRGLGPEDHPIGGVTVIARIVHVPIGREARVDEACEHRQLVLARPVPPLVAIGSAHDRVVVEGLRGAVPHPTSHCVGRARRPGVGAHPFTAPEVMPATIWRWKKMYMISGGIVMSSTSANSRL